MKALLIVSLSVLILSPMEAQQENFTSPSGFGNSYSLRTINEVKNVVGTPYLNEEFAESVIKMKDGKLYENVPLRYNIMSDEIEFKKSNGEIRSMANRDLAQWAIIGKDTIVTRKAGKEGKLKSGHFILLARGKANLLEKRRKIFKEATEPGAYSDGTDPKYADSGSEYYVSFKEESKALSFPKKKEVEVFFGDKGEALYTYLKKERLSLKKKDDLVTLINYYNSL